MHKKSHLFALSAILFLVLGQTGCTKKFDSNSKYLSKAAFFELFSFVTGAMMISGCGKHYEPSAATVTGNTSLGAVDGATVTVYQMSDSGGPGPIIGIGSTDSSGNFEVHLTRMPFQGMPLLIQSTGGSYSEESSGVQVTMTNTVSSVVPSSLIVAGSVSTVANNPLTDMATKRLITQMASGLPGGTTADTAASNANYAVGRAFGITGADIVGTLPASLKGAVPNDSTGQLALVLATISHEAHTSGVDSMAMANALGASFAATGSFSGGTAVSVTNAAGQTVSVTPPTFTAMTTVMSGIQSGTVPLAGIPTGTTFSSHMTAPVLDPAPPHNGASSSSGSTSGSTTIVSTSSPSADPCTYTVVASCMNADVSPTGAYTSLVECSEYSGSDVTTSPALDPTQLNCQAMNGRVLRTGTCAANLAAEISLGHIPSGTTLAFSVVIGTGTNLVNVSRHYTNPNGTGWTNANQANFVGPSSPLCQ